MPHWKLNTWQLVPGGWSMATQQKQSLAFEQNGLERFPYGRQAVIRAKVSIYGAERDDVTKIARIGRTAYVHGFVKRDGEYVIDAITGEIARYCFPIDAESVSVYLYDVAVQQDQNAEEPACG